MLLRVVNITKRLMTPTPALRNRIGGLSETAKGIIKDYNKEDNKHIDKSSKTVIKKREGYL